ncbi:MAG: outer membrane lipoprotein-sorting protein [Betaproteobacteria bacterium]|nr:outer membrane lipoprotein-sorting protein [Betaproteobacteria bacterium]MDH4323431.1 outer membrane lipoprotein-sorting protein [Betaproteobacteria bacterium]MDH5578980.1 outer membrane lipoprotein-sorting protein [Betaproteobacteria bacterium]
MENAPSPKIRGAGALPVLAVGVLLAAALTALVTPARGAQSDAERGLAIAREMKARDRGFSNATATMRMVLVDASGGETGRELRTKTLEGGDDGDKLLAVFETPADVRGTVFLSHTHRDRADDQWLYLPALKRVKRIAPANKSSPFMGSEFSYEDLASAEVTKYRYAYRGDEIFEGKPRFVLERVPVDPESGYSRQLVWVDMDRYVPLKIEFYDRRGDRLKTLVAREYRQYLGRYWRAHEVRMENHQSGKSTVLRWGDIRFRQGLNEQDFLSASMARAR